MISDKLDTTDLLLNAQTGRRGLKGKGICKHTGQKRVAKQKIMLSPTGLMDT